MRLIDADEFKRENERMLNCDFPYISEETLGELIDKAPTVEAVPMDFHDRCMEIEIEKRFALEKHGQWIPCSERLPDRFGKMLVTFVPEAGTLWTRVIIAHYSDLMGIAKPCFWIGNVGKNDFANITSQVVAWMPLPKPYKMDEREEK